MSDTEGTTPLNLDAIRERAVTYRANQMQHEKTGDRATALTAAAFLCAQDVPALLSAVASLTQDRDLWEKRYVEMMTQRDRAIQKHAQAQRDLSAAREQAEQAQAVVAEALDVFADLVDDERCHIDHNGYCQEHGLSGGRDRECRNVRMKRLLATSAPQPKAAGPSMWDDAALALLLRAKRLIVRAERAHCADDPWRKDASLWVGHHAAFTGDKEEPAAAVPSSGRLSPLRATAGRGAAYQEERARAKKSGGQATAADEPSVPRDFACPCGGRGCDCYGEHAHRHAQPATAGGTASSEQ